MAVHIAAAAAAVQPILREIQRRVQEAVPGAKPVMAYRMPAFRHQRTFFYFAAFKHHIGVYPPVRGPDALLRELAPYLGPKGNLKFPLTDAMPYDLITRVAVSLAEGYAGEQRPVIGPSAIG